MLSVNYYLTNLITVFAEWFQLNSRVIAHLLLIMGVLITGVFCYATKQNLDSFAQHKFYLACENIKHSIENQLGTHQSALIGASGLFNYTNTVTQDQWRFHIDYSNVWLILSTGSLASILLFLLVFNAKFSKFPSNQHTNTITLDNLSVGIWDWTIDTDKINYSTSWKNMLGYKNHELSDNLDTWKNLLHPEDLPNCFQEIARQITSENPRLALNFRLRHKDGTWVYIQSEARLVSDGNGEIVLPKRLLGTNTDITKSKLLEEAFRNEQVQLREVLIEEVHHRVKNNMQGIIGIMRQLANDQPLLAQSVNKAISQLQTITSIHGLQSKCPTSKIKLHELVQAICHTNSQLWQIPIHFSVSLDCVSWIIIEQEALPIALAFNELVLNAIKHSTFPKDISIAVQQNISADNVEILLSNPGRLPDNFNEDLQMKSGSGLKLARSLLPRNNANLVLQQRLLRVITILTLNFSILELAKEAT